MKKSKQIVQQNSFTEFLLYTTPNGKVKVEIFLHNENIWLTQARIAELFGVDRSVVTKHLRNIFKEGELDKKSTSAKIAQVQNEGQRQVTRDVEFYNLDAFLKFNEEEILQNVGKVSHEVAVALAEKEYKRFRIKQDRQFESDFDKLAKKLLKKVKNETL
jgi:hypothetical protein